MWNGFAYTAQLMCLMLIELIKVKLKILKVVFLLQSFPVITESNLKMFKLPVFSIKIMKIIGRGAINRNEIPIFWKETETAIFQGWLRLKLKSLVSKLYYLVWLLTLFNIIEQFSQQPRTKTKKKTILRVKCPIHSGTLWTL